MKRELLQIMEVGTELRRVYGKGQVSVEDVPKVPLSMAFFMGAHEAGTALEAARLIVRHFPRLPVLISGGGNGRGSWLLEKHATAICRDYGFRPLAPEEKTCEARILKRLLVEQGIDRRLIHLEEKAKHSEENWRFSVPIFERLGLRDGAVIGVVQSPLNRTRAQYTGEAVLQKNGFPKVRVQTIDFPPKDLASLSERDLV